MKRCFTRLGVVLLVALNGLLASALIVACGGGDPEPEPDKGTQPVDCQANPQACK